VETETRQTGEGFTQGGNSPTSRQYSRYLALQLKRQPVSKNVTSTASMICPTRCVGHFLFARLSCYAPGQVTADSMDPGRGGAKRGNSKKKWNRGSSLPDVSRLGS